MIVELPSNRPLARFYREGERMAVFRGEQGTPERGPKDCVGSVTTIFGESELGL